jgi:hypothetical protein
VQPQLLKTQLCNPQLATRNLATCIVSAHHFHARGQLSLYSDKKAKADKKTAKKYSETLDNAFLRWYLCSVTNQPTFTTTSCIGSL